MKSVLITEGLLVSSHCCALTLGLIGLASFAAASTVSVTGPSDNAVFTAPARITINADVSDSDGTIGKVEFFEGANKLGEDTTAIYSFASTDVAAGTDSLTARASARCPIRNWPSITQDSAGRTPTFRNPESVLNLREPKVIRAENLLQINLA